MRSHFYTVLTLFGGVWRREQGKKRIQQVPPNGLPPFKAGRPAVVPEVTKYSLDGQNRRRRSYRRSGYLNKDINARQLAEFIIACHESAFSMGKAATFRCISLGQPLQKLARAMQRLTGARQRTQLSPEMLAAFGRIGAGMGGIKRIPIQCLRQGPQFLFELLVAIGHQPSEAQQYED